jgi:hypothetical protein
MSKNKADGNAASDLTLLLTAKSNRTSKSTICIAVTVHLHADGIQNTEVLLTHRWFLPLFSNTPDGLKPPSPQASASMLSGIA